MLALLNTILAAFAPVQGMSRDEPCDLSDCFWWGGEHLRIANKVHAVAMGTTQSGKTTIHRLVMQDLLPQIRTRNNTRALIYDPKGDMHAILAAERYQLQSHIIAANPRLAVCQAWLMYLDIDCDDRAEECAETLVHKETSKDGQESFFTTTVRNLAKATMCGFIRKRVPWELRDLLLAMVNDAALDAMLTPHFDTAKTLHLALYQRPETAQDVRSSINNLFNRFSSVAAQWHYAARERPGFSISEWATTNQLLVLPGASGDGDPLQIMTQVLFDQIAIRVLGGPEALHVRPHPPRIFIFVDELRQAGYLKRLKDLLFMSASKGARCYLGAQGIEGLRAVFGNDEAAELMSLCAIKAFLLAHGSESAEWMSKQIHSQLVTEEEIGISSGGQGETVNKTTRRVVRELVQAIRFLHLHTPELNGSFEGFFLAPELRRKRRDLFWKRMPAHVLYDEPNGLLWPNGPADCLQLRDRKQQILPPWDRADLERLELPAIVLAQQTNQARFTSISYKLFE